MISTATSKGYTEAIDKAVKATYTAKSGTTYYYTVRAVKGTQQSSYKSSSSVKRT